MFSPKVPVSEAGAPSNKGWHPSMGNPGSAPVVNHYIGAVNLLRTFVALSEVYFHATICVNYGHFPSKKGRKVIGVKFEFATILANYKPTPMVVIELLIFPFKVLILVLYSLLLQGKFHWVFI